MGKQHRKEKTEGWKEGKELKAEIKPGQGIWVKLMSETWEIIAKQMGLTERQER